MKNSKKVVDLIYVEAPKNEAILVAEYKEEIDFWARQLKSLQKWYFERHFDSQSADVTEVMSMRKFLKQFLLCRLNWILEEVDNPTRKLQYLKVLPPFYQDGKIKKFFIHFFQVEESKDKKHLCYVHKSDQDKEIAILWDMYKLRKTISSINTILKAIKNDPPFKSQFSKSEQIECLEALKSTFQLMFQMCIKREYLQELYSSILVKHVTPEAILERKEASVFLVYPHLLEKFNYRNHFFFIYFFPSMKAKIGGKIKEFHFNYLDFELIKQEFLIDWVGKKLKNNPLKEEIYDRYCLNNISIAQLVKDKPENELKILQQLPTNIFNDLIAEIDCKVSRDKRSGVSTMSEKYGEVAVVQRHYQRARKLVACSVGKLKKIIKTDKTSAKITTKPRVAETSPTREETEYKIFAIKKKQIDFPYFQHSTTGYKQRLSLLRIKMGSEVYKEYNATVTQKLQTVSEGAFIQRRTPQYEIVMPFHLIEKKEEEVINHLIIVGADVKAKALGMGYSAVSSDNKTYTAFFVYGCDREIPEMGDIMGTRRGRGVDFNEYDFVHPQVQEKFLELFQLTMDKGKL